MFYLIGVNKYFDPTIVQVEELPEGREDLLAFDQYEHARRTAEDLVVLMDHAREAEVLFHPSMVM